MNLTVHRTQRLYVAEASTNFGMTLTELRRIVQMAETNKFCDTARVLDVLGNEISGLTLEESIR